MKLFKNILLSLVFYFYFYDEIDGKIMYFYKSRALKVYLKKKKKAYIPYVSIQIL